MLTNAHWPARSLVARRRVGRARAPLLLLARVLRRCCGAAAARRACVVGGAVAPILTNTLHPTQHLSLSLCSAAFRPLGKAAAGRRLAVRVAASKQLKDRTTVKSGQAAPADAGEERVLLSAFAG